MGYETWATIMRSDAELLTVSTPKTVSRLAEGSSPLPEPPSIDRRLGWATSPRPREIGRCGNPVPALIERDRRHEPRSLCAEDQSVRLPIHDPFGIRCAVVGDPRYSVMCEPPRVVLVDQFVARRGLRRKLHFDELHTAVARGDTVRLVVEHADRPSVALPGVAESETPGRDRRDSDLMTRGQLSGKPAIHSRSQLVLHWCDVAQ